MRSALALAALALILAPARPAFPSPPPSRTAARAPRLQSFDTARRLDLNRIHMVVANNGSFGFDNQSAAPGAWYPAGSPTSVLFAGGLWLGGRYGPGNSVRATVSEYSSEYTPGDWVGGIDQSGMPEHRVYKVARYVTAADTGHLVRDPGDLTADFTLDSLVHDSWSEYMAGAVPHGAPWRLHRLPDTSTSDPSDSVDVPGPDVLGDVMLWSVYHDGDASRHTAFPGRSAPLGVEVQQTTFAFDRPGPLANTVFFRYRIVHHGSTSYAPFIASVWSDPDVGGFTDDLTGFGPARGVGFAYNGPSYDNQFGFRAPAPGFLLLESHASDGPADPQSWPSFVVYINGTDPRDSLHAFATMSGLYPDGSTIIDPVTTLPTTRMFPGDPVAGTGWLDTNPSDRRMLCSAPQVASFDPGDTLTLWVAMIVGAGTSVNGSIAALTCESDYISQIWDSGLAEPFPSPGTCGETPPAPVNCPRRLAYWDDQCQGVNPQYSPADVALIAHAADSTSAVFDWGGGNAGYLAFCATLDPPSPGPADSARAEYAAFLMNLLAGRLGIAPTGGAPIGLVDTSPIAGAPLIPTFIGVLSIGLPERVVFGFADYVDVTPAHPAALEAANIPGILVETPVGATFASNLLSSTISPFDVDSFPARVEIRFDASGGQLAYRFLRPERQSDGFQTGPPFAIYAGRHLVPFTVIDTTSGDTLEVAFMERVVTDDFGTILDPSAQPVTFDSTWAPTDADNGGHERLWILRRPYSAAGRAEFEVDDLPVLGNWPALYVVSPRLTSPLAVIDDGDLVRIDAVLTPTPSAEQLLLRLASAPPSDTAAVRQYRQLADYLAAINRGDGLGALCNDPTPVLVSLYEAAADPDQVRITWYLGGSPARSARLERSDDGIAWLDLGAVALGGDGWARATDTRVVPGARYAYRLALTAADGASRSAAVWVDVPRAARLDLAGLRPNPATGSRLLVSFSLPRRAPASLELLDLAGRRIERRDVGALGAGWHLVDLGEASRVPPGLYVIRLAQGEDVLTRKAVVVR